MRKILEKSTPIINEIIEKLAQTKLSSYEYMIIFAVFRKTYGWDKKEDWISGGQLSELTGILNSHCFRTLKKLIQKKIIIKNKKKIGINKRTSQWILPKQVVPKQVYTKKTLTKERLQKKEEGFDMNFLFEQFWKKYPRKQNKKGAKEKFLKLDPQLLSTIESALTEQKKLKQWKEGIIPHATTWLNQERWNDETPLTEEEELFAGLSLSDQLNLKKRILTFKQRLDRDPTPEEINNFLRKSSGKSSD